MPLTSMTGFSRADGERGTTRWHWELRSVNGKGLDMRFRLPNGLESIEARLREEMGRQLKRGNCQVSLTLVRQGAAAPLSVNQEALAAVLSAIRQLQGEMAAALVSFSGADLEQLDRSLTKLRPVATELELTTPAS